MKRLHSTNFNKELISKVLKAIELVQKHNDTHKVYVTNRKGENIISVKKVRVGNKVMFHLLDRTNFNICFELSGAAHYLRMTHLSTFFVKYLASDGELMMNKPFMTLCNIK